MKGQHCQSMRWSYEPSMKPERQLDTCHDACQARVTIRRNKWKHLRGGRPPHLRRPRSPRRQTFRGIRARGLSAGMLCFANSWQYFRRLWRFIDSTCYLSSFSAKGWNLKSLLTPKRSSQPTVNDLRPTQLRSRCRAVTWMGRACFRWASELGMSKQEGKTHGDKNSTCISKSIYWVGRPLVPKVLWYVF